jgi:hypothetical protein
VNAAQRAEAAVAAIRALAEAIRTAREIPSGHLYAIVHGQMTLSGYQAAIGLLKEAKLVEEQNYLLRWIGPGIPDAELGAYRAAGRDEFGVDLLADPERLLKAIEGEEEKA